MKKTAWYCGALVLAVLNAVYLALTADSFYLEYVKDEFVYWGYPQWGWMYSDPKIYLWFNVLYLAFLLLLFAAGLFPVLAACAYFQKWFPPESAAAWAGFTALFFLLLAVITLCFEAVFAIQGKRYEGLLGEYHRRRAGQDAPPRES